MSNILAAARTLLPARGETTAFSVVVRRHAIFARATDQTNHMGELALSLSQTRIARYRENQIMADGQPQLSQERVVMRPLQLVAHYVHLGDREESLAFEVCFVHCP